MMAEGESVDAGRWLRTSARHLVDELTPGQRWTTGLLIGLAVAVLAFGLPDPIRLVSQLPPAQASAADPGPVDTLERGDGAATARPSPAAIPFVAPAPTDPAASPATAPVAEDLATPVIDEPTREAVRFVVLVEDGRDLPDRSNDAMARRFLELADLDAAVVAIDEDAFNCDAVKGAHVAVAIGPVPTAVADCLRGHGILALGWDDTAPADPSTEAISTRWGAARSLLDTARGLGSEFDGRIALLADARLRPAIESALVDPAVVRMGIDDVVWLTDDVDSDIAVELAGSQTDQVIFATSSDRQSAIASQIRTLSPGTSFFALDAGDAVISQRLSPAMDGARAVTSIQFPWHAGAAAVRSACQEQWESGQVPPTTLDDDELLRALLWCQQIGLAADVRDATADDVLARIRGVQADSPVTSPLAAASDGSFGPVALTIATWSAACSCWQTEQPFSTRAAT